MNDFSINKHVDYELTTISKNTLIYSSGNIVSKAVSFLLIPLYTHYLSTYEVGIVVLLELLEVLFNYLAPLGILSALWRFFNIEQKEGNVNKYISSIFFFILGINTVFLVIFILLAHWTAKFYLCDESFTNLLRVFFVVLFLGLSRIFILTLLRIYEKAFQFIVFVFTDFLLLLVLTIWFVIGLNLGLWGVIWAKIITASLISILTLIYVLKQYGFRYDHQNIIRALRYGLPFVFHGISLLILTMSDRYFIKALISIETAAVYGIAYKFGMIMNMVLVTPFVQAWRPILFRLENDPNQKLTYKKVALHYVQIATPVWLMISVISKYIAKLTTTEEYYSGIIIIPWIAFAYLLYGLQNVFTAGALINNKTLKMTGYTMFSAAINILLNALMIPKWGILGAAVATVLSYLLMLVFVLRLSQKHLYINWHWEKMLSVLALGSIFSCLSLINLTNVRINFVKDVSILILLPLMLIILKLVSLKEVKRFVLSFKAGY